MKSTSGFLLCAKTIQCTNLTFNSWGNVYGVDYNANQPFPVKFIDPPKIVAVNTNASMAGSVTRITCDNTKVTTISIMRGSKGDANITYGVDYIAIGRWK